MLTLSFVELHKPLFLAGKNFGMKLYTSKNAELSMVYDREEKELHVTWKGKTAIVPWGNVVSMQEVEE